MTTTEYRNCVREGDTITGEQRYVEDSETGSWGSFSGSVDLLRIHEALFLTNESFGRIWSLSDGYGEPGFWPSQGYDWSGIRDSSQDAIKAMHEVAREYVSDADFDALFGLTSDARLAETLLAALDKVDGTDGDIAALNAEAAILQRLGVPLDQTEQGLTRAAVGQIEEFVSAYVGRSWTFQGTGFLGADAEIR